MGYSRILPRRGTYYEWNTVDPILVKGELVIEVPDSGVGTGLSRFKIGDGALNYSKLPYAFDGAEAASINGGTVIVPHTIQIRTGTTEEWTTTDPVLVKNEITYDSTVNAFKVGDGKSKWSALAYTMSSGDLSTVNDYGDEG